MFNGRAAQVVMRLMADGNEDTSFGDEGKTVTVFDSLSYYYYFVNAAVIQADGSVLLGGNLITRYHNHVAQAPLIVKSNQ